MKTSPRTLLVLLAIVLCLILGALLVHRMTEEGGSPASAAGAGAGGPQAGTDAGTDNAPTTLEMKSGEDDVAALEVEGTGAAVRALQGWLERFRALLEEPGLDEATRKQRALTMLEAMREEMRGDPGAYAGAILAFLDSGADSATGLGFTLGDGGVLEEAPTLRTAMLDLLAQMDPVAAVEYAQRIFETSRVADEWALAMRNLGWQNQEGHYSGELRTRLAQMLDNSEWIARPSGGFLEAFDTAVHLGGREEILNMASVVRLEYENGTPLNNGTTHAAYLALDRIAFRNPGLMLETLTGDPSLLAWAPEHRASLVARADVSQPAHREAVERYLGTLAGRTEELATFTELFPNRNGSLGNTLVSTPAGGPGFEAMLAQDEAALRAVREWIRAGRYPALEASLRQIEQRLNGFVSGARGR